MSEVKVHIFVNKGVGHQATRFYRTAFGGLQVDASFYKRDDAASIVEELLTTEVRIGHDVIIVSELDPKSNLRRWIPNVPNQSAIRLVVKDFDRVVRVARVYECVFEQDITETHLGRVAWFRDPYGSSWMICEMPTADMLTPAAECDDVPTSSFPVVTPDQLADDLVA